MKPSICQSRKFPPSNRRTRHYPVDRVILLILPFVVSLFIICPSSAFQNLRLKPYTNKATTRLRDTEPFEFRIEQSPKIVLKIADKIRENGKLRTTGAVLAFFVIFGLAANFEVREIGTHIEGVNNLDEFTQSTMNNVIGASLPTTTLDFISSSLSESLVGFIGVSASISINFIFKLILKAAASREKRRPIIGATVDNSNNNLSSSSLPATEDADANMALVSSQPSMEQEKEKSFLFNVPGLNKRDMVKLRRKIMKPEVVTETSEKGFDPIEVFSDVARWLEYGVLQAEYADTLIMNYAVLNPWTTSALLGFVAAISSQLYADILYGIFGYGPESRQEEVLSRKSGEWATVYTSRALSSGALFCVYELSQLPIYRYIQGTLAGGVEGCFGSNNFDLCLSSYIDLNAPGPSPEAQFRALATNLVMVQQRLKFIAADTSLEDIQALLATWTASADTYFHHFFPL